MNFLRTLKVVSLASACCVLHLPSLAGTLTLNGDTTGAPTFQRPIEDLSALSSIGTAAHFDAWTFSAPVTGTHTFRTSGGFDTFALLYTTPFSSATPLANALVANDDLSATPFTVSGFAFDLVAGKSYTYVVTGFDNDEYGAFTSSIAEPAVVVNVPEPGTWALMAVGFGALPLLRRRRAVVTAMLTRVAQ